MSWKSLLIGNLVEEGHIDIQTGPFGTQLKASEYTEIGTPVINVRNIGYSSLRADKLEFVPEQKRDQLAQHVLLENDIVFGRKGAVDRHLFVQEEQSGWVQGSDCIRLRFLSNKISPRFISYLFLLDSHKEWMLTQCSNKATMASLNQDVIKRIPVKIPNETTQEKIVEFLSNYDDLIDNNNRRIALLEEAVHRLYREWFVHLRFPGHERVAVVDGVPEGWEKIALGEIADRYNGIVQTGPFGSQLHKSDYVEQGIPVVMPKNIKGDKIALDTIAFIDEATATRLSRHILNIGDIVFPRRGDLNKRALISKNEAGYLCGTGCLKISIPQQKLSSLYLFNYLRGQEAVNFINNNAVGATMANLSAGILKSLPVLLPHKNVQKHFEKITSPVFEQTNLLHSQNVLLREARDRLLPRLMNGSITV